MSKETEAENKRKARELLGQKWFQEWLREAYNQCYPYRFGDIEHNIQHIHHERNGGHKAVILFIQKLKEIPFDIQEKQESDEYIGFSEPEVANNLF